MRVLYELPAEFEQLAEKLKKAGALLIEGVEPLERGFVLDREADLLKQEGDRLYVLREGFLSCALGGKQLFFYEEGDLLGYEGRCGAGIFEIKSEFAVRLDVYDTASVRCRADSGRQALDLFEQYFLSYLAVAVFAWGEMIRQEADLSPSIAVFEAGEIIVRENSPADQVLNLVKGHAEVSVAGVKVGEVLEDEIFGALAALTDTTRTATVKASRRCEVLSLAKDNFLGLIESRPRTVLKMVQDMARTIVALNNKVVELGFKKG